MLVAFDTFARIQMVLMLSLSLIVSVAVAKPLNDYVHVPGADGILVHESCVHEVPNGVVVDDSFDLSCEYDAMQPNEQVYAMDSHTDGSIAFTQMNSSFVVPPYPAQASGQTVFFWPGFKAQKPEGGYPVLQPVLQYGQRPGQEDWELQSWFVWAKHFLPIQVTAPAIKVLPGDHITSYMDYDETEQIWTVYGRNDANGEESVLKVTNKKVGKQNFEYAMHVLETVMSRSRYCDLYPPNDSIEFTNISANRGDGVEWIARTGKTDCQQQVVPSAIGDNVKFTWHSATEEVVTV